MEATITADSNFVMNASRPARPLHQQISDWLRDQIQKEVYAADQRLPSESEIGRRFKVSRITVRRALHTLEHEHLIYRHQGLGSFVQGHRLKQGLVRLTDFVEDMTELGLEPSTRLLFGGPVDPPADIFQILELAPNQRPWRLDRLRFGDDEVIAFDQTWLPGFYAQLLEGCDLERETIYHIFERRYGIPVLFGRYRIEAVSADAELAGHLSVPIGDAILLVERTSVTEQNRRIYFQRRYYRGTRVAYELELQRDPMRSPDRAAHVVQEFEPVFRKSR